MNNERSIGRLVKGFVLCVGRLLFGCVCDEEFICRIKRGVKTG